METFGKVKRSYLSSVSTPEQWLIDVIQQNNVNGISVSPENAIKYSAVWSATRLLSESVASMPCIVYERMLDESRVRAPDHQLFALLYYKPNPIMDAFTFWQTMTAWLVNFGNAFAEVERSRLDGRIFALHPIHPSRVRIDMEDGYPIYYVRNDNGTDMPLYHEEMLNIVGPLTDDGLNGKGVFGYARETIGSGIAMERYQNRFYSNNGLPSAVLTLQDKINEQRASEIRRQWTKEYGGGQHAGGVGILPASADLKILSVPAQAAQYIESKTTTVDDIARFYRIPPHLLMEMSHATFSNIDSQSQEFLSITLNPWLRRMEMAVNTQLITEEDRRDYFAEFLRESILMMETEKRVSKNRTELLNGIITIGEWCRRDNLPAPPAHIANTRFFPKNMTTVEQIISGQDADVEPAEKPAGSPPGEPDYDQPDEQPGDGYQAAFSIALDDAMQRLGKVEQTAVARALKNGTNLNAVYSKHEVLLADALAHVEAIAKLSGVAFDAKTYAANHCAVRLKGKQYE